MGKFSKIHCAKSPFHQNPHATRSLTSSEKDALSGKKGGIHTTMWKAVKNIFSKK